MGQVKESLLYKNNSKSVIMFFFTAPPPCMLGFKLSKHPSSCENKTKVALKGQI